MDEEIVDLYAKVVDGLGDCVVFSFHPQDATVKINSLNKFANKDWKGFLYYITISLVVFSNFKLLDDNCVYPGKHTKDLSVK